MYSQFMGFGSLDFLSKVPILKQDIDGGSIGEGSTHEPKVRVTLVHKFFIYSRFFVKFST
jgi:hypothetical protein